MEKKTDLFSLAPTSFTEAKAFAELLVQSGFLPEHYDHPGKVLAAMQLCHEVGLPIMSGLLRIKVIKGNPSMDVRGMLAVVEASGLLEAKDEAFDAEKVIATVIVQRKGRKPVTRTFSQAEALLVPHKEDGKWIKLGESAMYRAWPQRMYTRRALGFALMDEFSDIIGGLVPTEYAEDAEQMKQVGASATPAAAAAAEPPAHPMAALDETVQQALTAAFDAVKFSPAQRLIHLNRYKGKEDELLDFLRDEYAARQGKKRKAKTATLPAGLPAPEGPVEPGPPPSSTTAVVTPSAPPPVDEVFKPISATGFVE